MHGGKNTRWRPSPTGQGHYPGRVFEGAGQQAKQCIAGRTATPYRRRHPPWRIGFTGVGKSTFIETLGCYLCDQQWRVAVLSIDPSSSLNGGSILGDKTRMPGLSAHTNAYIRPTPSGDALGGVAGATRESILLCEAAGFNVILVETVGVGQSEIAVADMTDIFLLLLLPSTGDELQGIKRGIVERADIILINKADGALLNAAQQTVADYRSALQLLRKNTLTGADIPGVDNPVMPMSALDRAGIQGIWGNLLSHWQALNKNPALEDKRQQQRLNWMREKLHSAVYRLALKNLATRQSLEQFEALVSQASLSPGSAIEQIMDALG